MNTRGKKADFRKKNVSIGRGGGLTYFSIFRIESILCLFVYMSDHNSGTPLPIASNFDWGIN